MLWLRQKRDLSLNKPKHESRFKQLFKRKQPRNQPDNYSETVSEAHEEASEDKADLYSIVPYASPHPSVRIKALRKSLSTVVAPRPPSTHLRIKAQETHDRLLTPHRSPPSRPYTPTSTTSSSVTTSTPTGQASSAFASIDEEESTDEYSIDIRDDTENTSFSTSAEEEKVKHDPNPFATIPFRNQSNTMSFIPAKNPARIRRKPPTLRQSMVRDDSSSVYSSSIRLSVLPAPLDNPCALPNTKTSVGNKDNKAPGPGSSDETWFQQRASGWKRNKNRISSVLPQQYRSKPLTRTSSQEFAIPARHRPVMRPPVDPELVRSGTTKSSRRISVASSLSSILPYIISYNNMSTEDIFSPQKSHTAPNIDITGIQETYATVEHVEQAGPPSIYEQNRRIEQLLQRRATPPPVQPLRIRKPAAPSVPCQAGVREYAQQLDLDFEPFEGIEPDYQFREQILRGTSYSVRRRSRVLDKDLPALPYSGGAPKRLDTFRDKFRLFV